MKRIDWNEASNLNLVRYINKEILHPLGLALCRDIGSGASPCLIVADDGEWCYPDDEDCSIDVDKIKEFVKQINSKEV